MTAGHKPPVSVYSRAIASVKADPTKAYNPDDAIGCIRLDWLRLKVVAKLQRKVKK